MIKLTRLLRLLCLSLLVCVLIIVVPAIGQLPTTATQLRSLPETSNLVERGLSAYQAGQYLEAIRVWQQAEKDYSQEQNVLNRVSTLNYLSLAYQELEQWQKAEHYNSLSLKLFKTKAQIEQQNSFLFAQLLNTKGSIELATGKAEAALETWQQAENAYQNAGDKIGTIGSKIDRAQALQSLGLYRQSQKLLEQLHQELDNQTDLLLKAKLSQSLGITLQTNGDLKQAKSLLKESLDITKKLNLPEETAHNLFNLGNNAKLAGNYPQAIAFYRQTAMISLQPLTQLEARLNLLNLLITTEQWDSIQALLIKIEANLNSLSPSRPLLYARVNLAKNLIDLSQKNTTYNNSSFNIENLLRQTKQQAEQLQDLRSESFALGTLGHWYETKQQWSQARQVTQQALELAQILSATDIAYQWQWQLGRLSTVEGKNQAAISYYKETVNNLQSLRSSMVTIPAEAQFSFRQSVEPVYRELVGLLLQDRPSQEQLRQARETIESLQLAELENFFQQACLDRQTKQIEEIDPNAAVVYPIILPDRLAVILSLPDRSLHYYATNISQAKIEETLDNFYQSLNPAFSNRQRLEFSQQIYKWLIEPANNYLSKAQIKTLVFVLDSSLRNLPMAALYDGDRYLIQQYNIALTPGLQLLPSQGLQAKKIEALVAGISKSVRGFSSLPGVKQEAEYIASQIPSQVLLDQHFTKANLQQKLEQIEAPILHLASHGQFSSDSDQTFILTWNDRIKVKELENILDSRDSDRTTPIELMVLSACQTAAGDKQAALGMAGMAVRSGARSTLATLWSVEDYSTNLLMNEFYRVLAQSESNLTKAEALRQAQLSLLQSQNFSLPYYWAAFVLVGNWL